MILFCIIVIIIFTIVIYVTPVIIGMNVTIAREVPSFGCYFYTYALLTEHMTPVVRHLSIYNLLHVVIVCTVWYVRTSLVWSVWLEILRLAVLFVYSILKDQLLASENTRFRGQCLNRYF